MPRTIGTNLQKYDSGVNIPNTRYSFGLVDLNGQQQNKGFGGQVSQVDEIIGAVGAACQRQQIVWPIRSEKLVRYWKLSTEALWPFLSVSVRVKNILPVGLSKEDGVYFSLS